jgi:hypothetical protein
MAIDKANKSQAMTYINTEFKQSIKENDEIELDGDQNKKDNKTDDYRAQKDEDLFGWRVTQLTKWCGGLTLPLLVIVG